MTKHNPHSSLELLMCNGMGSGRRWMGGGEEWAGACRGIQAWAAVEMAATIGTHAMAILEILDDQ
jgi:hypothetical protein